MEVNVHGTSAVFHYAGHFMTPGRVLALIRLLKSVQSFTFIYQRCANKDVTITRLVTTFTPTITRDATQRLLARTRHYACLRVVVSEISQESLMSKIEIFLGYALFVRVFHLQVLRTLSNRTYGMIL
jgi:hypothetical protein